MQTLHIVAAGPESARGLIDALHDFDAELLRTSDGGYEVKIELGASDRETVAVLNALEQYVNDRAMRAEITLNGREYVMHPDPAT